MATVNEIYNETFLKIGRNYDVHFKRDPDGFKKMVQGARGPAKVGASICNIMVSKKMCRAIEDLPKDIKLELWEEAKTWCPGAEKEKLIDVCKLIWAIEHL